MKRILLNEGIKLSKLPIIFSSDLFNNIKRVSSININNETINEWYDFLETIKRHYSYSSIAWDYANNQVDEIKNNNDLGYNVVFTIKIDETDNEVYVEIINFDIVSVARDLGMNVPYDLCENEHRNNKIIIEESQLRQIIRETLKRILFAS